MFKSDSIVLIILFGTLDLVVGLMWGLIRRNVQVKFFYYAGKKQRENVQYQLLNMGIRIEICRKDTT